MTALKELQSLLQGMQQLVERANQPKIQKPLRLLSEACEQVAESWSGSDIGYHSLVYYQDLQKPPPGAFFSAEWGLKKDGFLLDSTRGEWQERDAGDVIKEIRAMAGYPDTEHIRELSKKISYEFNTNRKVALSILSLIEDHSNDNYLKDLEDNLKQLSILGFNEIVKIIQPPRQKFTSDMRAMNGGLILAPHNRVLQEIMHYKGIFLAAEEFAGLMNQVLRHLQRRGSEYLPGYGTKVFIAHGHSQAWEELKRFLEGELMLSIDEFNSTAAAGKTGIERLSEMMNNATIAFLVMTGEDEQVDGAMRPRMNVIHEVGLFQGRLGFARAIILLEEGCEQFSNIHGLTHIPFSRGQISDAFEEIKGVLIREGVLRDGN